MTERSNPADEILALSRELEANTKKWQRDNAKFMSTLQDALTDFRQAERGLGLYDPDLDAPLSIEQLVCLPELGGELFYNVDVSVPSPTVAVKAVRAAISSNRLGMVAWNSSHRSTRRHVQQWLASCTTEAGQASPVRRQTLKKEAKSTVVDLDERDVAKNAAALMLAKLMKKGS